MGPRVLIAALCALPAPGCGPGAAPLSPGTGTCELDLSRNVVNFGVVEINRTGVRPFEIENLGDGPCDGVTSELVYVQPGLPTLLEFAEGGRLQGPFTIPARAALGVPLVGGPHEAVEDPLLAVVEVRRHGILVGQIELIGQSRAAPALLIVPNSLFFCGSGMKTATLLNTGPLPWRLTRLEPRGAFNVDMSLVGTVVDPSRRLDLEVQADFGRALGGGPLQLRVESESDAIESTLDVVFLDCGG